MAIVTIELENMEFRAFHGCYDLEKKVGNRFRVDVRVEVEAADAVEHDRLAGTANYLTLFEVVRAEMAITSDTLEHVAGRIAGALRRACPQIQNVEVKVAKLAPPLGGKIEKVSVTLRR